MPIYEYECTQCNHHFDKKQSFSDEAVATCPKCHNKSSRVMVPAPVIFKGSGFYVTDYRKKSDSGSASDPKNCCVNTSSPSSTCSKETCTQDSCSAKK